MLILAVRLSMYKPLKRFQMKTTGCRDVQHTGLLISPGTNNYYLFVPQINHDLAESSSSDFVA